MPSCAVCTHDQRKAIEADLASGKAQRDVARRYRLRKDSVHRHMLHHLKPAIVNGLAKREYRAADDALALRDRAMKWLDGCQTAISDAIAGRKANGEPLSFDDVAGANEKLKQVPAMIGRVKDCIDLIGRISGEVPTGSQVTNNFFLDLGVRDKAEAQGLIAQARLLRDANADGDEDSALEVLEGVLRDDPARREPLSRKMMRMIGDVARVDSQPASLGSSPPSRRPRPAPLNGDSA